MVFHAVEPVKYQLKNYDKVPPDVVDSALQRLYFRLNVKSATVEEVENFLNDMFDIDIDIELDCIDSLIDFDYYITLDILPLIRDLIKKYERKRFVLEVWQFGLD